MQKNEADQEIPAGCLVVFAEILIGVAAYTILTRAAWLGFLCAAIGFLACHIRMKAHEAFRASKQ